VIIKDHINFMHYSDLRIIYVLILGLKLLYLNLNLRLNWNGNQSDVFKW